MADRQRIMSFVLNESRFTVRETVRDFFRQPNSESAILPRRTGAIGASLIAADGAGSARGTTKTVAPGKTIAATVAADCDKIPACTDRAAVIPGSPSARQMESLRLRWRSRALVRVSRSPSHTRRARRQRSREFGIRQSQDYQRAVQQATANRSIFDQVACSSR